MSDLLTIDKSTNKYPLPDACQRVCHPKDDNCKVDAANYQKYLKQAVANQPKSKYYQTRKCLEKKYCSNTKHYMYLHCNTTNLS